MVKLISLLRPMRDADKPVADPKGKGRTSRGAQHLRVKGGAAVNVAATPNILVQAALRQPARTVQYDERVRR